MEKSDVDDVFKDFHHKVENKKESKKMPQKELGEEEIITKDYQREKQALKEKYNKEMHVIKSKRVREDLKKGKIPHNFSSNERIVYIAVILILAVFIIVDFSFIHGKSDSEDKKSAAAGTINVVSDTEEENKTVEKVEEVKEENPKEEVKEPVEEEVEEEMTLSGKITLTISRIDSKKDDDDLGEISEITFTIDNGKNAVLYPVVNVYAYDTENKNDYETKSRGEYTFSPGIASGAIHTASISLTPKKWINLNLDKNIRLTLDDADGDLITAVNKVVTIS